MPLLKGATQSHTYKALPAPLPHAQKISQVSKVISAQLARRPLARLPVKAARPETTPPINAVIKMSAAVEPPSGSNDATFTERI